MTVWHKRAVVQLRVMIAINVLVIVGLAYVAIKGRTFAPVSGVAANLFALFFARSTLATLRRRDSANGGDKR